jgi:AraC family transcriptional regulator of adaptative response/methylated-DNA-[protein]-cysteine methyltransferase
MTSVRFGGNGTRRNGKTPTNLDPGDVRSDPRWRASLDRDAAWDGAFVLAVSSTGIYCRPTCPARRPRPEVVRFYADPDTAEEDGYRACKRCKPRDFPPHLEEAERVRRACRWVQAQPDAPVSTARLAEVAGLHPRTLQRVFRRHVGLSPSEFAEACRISHFKGLMRDGASVTDATYAAGYGSPSRAYAQAAGALGMTPGQYARGGDGTSMRYATGRSPLGIVLLAATEVGICALYLGDNEAELTLELAKEFPRAEFEPDPAGLRPWLELVGRHLAGDAPSVELPLDVRATAFQRRVWRLLQSIPRGETRTYAELAEALGQPTAARAVGGACARNPVSVVVPCHRAVRADGGLGGYRWGLNRKRALLASERAD